MEILQVATYFSFVRSGFGSRFGIIIAIVAKKRLRHRSGNAFVILSSSPSLAASPFFQISVSSMNLTGGTENFKSASRLGSKDSYGKRLRAEIVALLEKRDICGITELNAFWFQWLTTQDFYVKGKFRSFHDGHDCAIVYDSQKFEVTIEAAVTKQIIDSELKTYSNKSRLDWRQHIVVSFCLRASPQVTFTVACTHTRVGKDRQEIAGSPERAAKRKGIIAMRALQRVLENHHRPILEAGFAKHLTIFVGDWNITEENMRDRAVQATSSSFSMGVGSTSLCAKGTRQRDLAVVFADDQHWEATRDDTIPKSTMKALDRSIGEHHPLFFM